MWPAHLVLVTKEARTLHASLQELAPNVYDMVREAENVCCLWSGWLPKRKAKDLSWTKHSPFLLKFPTRTPLLPTSGRVNEKVEEREVLMVSLLLAPEVEKDRSAPTLLSFCPLCPLGPPQGQLGFDYSSWGKEPNVNLGPASVLIRLYPQCQWLLHS